MTTGSLATIAGSPFASSASVTFSATADRTRTRLYFANQGNVLFTAYAIDSQSGALAHLAGSPMDLDGNRPLFVAASPESDDLYVSTSSVPAVYQLRSTASSLARVGTFDHPDGVKVGQIAFVPARL